MFALSSKITAPRALTASKPAKAQRRGLVVKVRVARRLVSRARFIHSTRRAEFVRRARAIAASSVARARAHGAKASRCFAYLQRDHREGRARRRGRRGYVQDQSRAGHPGEDLFEREPRTD